MKSDVIRKERQSRALELANLGISSGADGNYETARNGWREALAYAEQHLLGDNIIPWIQSGLGDALLRCDDYHGALEMANSAVAYCASVRAPLVALTMLKAHLRLGDVKRARDYAQRACSLRGEAVLRVLSPAERDTLRPIA